MSDNIPTQHTAGDSFAATVDGGTYPATAGWAVSLVLIGPERVTLASTASGAHHALAASATTTAAWAAGDYTTRIVYANAGSGQRVTGAAGSLRVLPDPLATGTDAAALKGAAQRRLDALLAARDAYIANGSAHVAEYQINGRTMKFRSLAELQSAINAAQREVQAEAAAARVAAGLSPRITYVTRM